MEATRRSFLGALAALPFLRFLKPEPKLEFVWRVPPGLFPEHVVFYDLTGRDKATLFYQGVQWDVDGFNRAVLGPRSGR